MSKLILVAISGICWTIVYIELIRRGFKDKACGMPLFALGLNIAWEFIYSYDGFLGSQSFIMAQNIADLAWAVCDVMILVTWFRYGRETMNKSSRPYFVPYSVLALAACTAMQLAFYLHFSDKVLASQYSAFAQNAAMSILFLTMLFQRENTKAQSMTIAVCKMIGTLTPTILGGFVESFNIYIIIMGAVAFVFDMLYIFCLARFKKEEAGA